MPQQCLNTGIVSIIDQFGKSGTIKKDSDGSDIAFRDRNMPTDIIVGSKVCFDIVNPGPSEFATNLKLYIDETIITDPVVGDLLVGKNEMVVLQTSVSGDVKVDGGAISLTTGASVAGDVKGKNGSTIGINGNASVGGDVKLEDQSLTLTLSEAWSIKGDVKVKDSQQIVVNGNGHLSGDLKAEKVTGIVINGNGEINGDLKAKTVSNISIIDFGISEKLEVKECQDADGKIDIVNAKVGKEMKARKSNNVYISKITVSNANDNDGELEVKDCDTVSVTDCIIHGELKIKNNTNCSQSGNTSTSQDISSCP